MGYFSYFLSQSRGNYQPSLSQSRGKLNEATSMTENRESQFGSKSKSPPNNSIAINQFPITHPTTSNK